MSSLILFENYFKIPIRFFHLAGFIANKLDENNSLFLQVTWIFIVLILNDISSACQEIIFLWFPTKQFGLEEYAFQIMNITYRILAISKMLAINKYNKSIKKLLKRFQQLYPIDNSEMHEKYAVKKYFKFAYRLMAIYGIQSIASTLSFVIFVFYAILSGFYFRGKINIIFLTNLWYPFDEYNPKWFFFCFIQQFFAVHLPIGMACIDTLLVSFIMQIGMHFNYIGKKCTQICVKKNASISDVKNIIKYHQNILRLEMEF